MSQTISQTRMIRPARTQCNSSSEARVQPLNRQDRLYREQAGSGGPDGFDAMIEKPHTHLDGPNPASTKGQRVGLIIDILV